MAAEVYREYFAAGCPSLDVCEREGLLGLLGLVVQPQDGVLAHPQQQRLHAAAVLAGLLVKDDRDSYRQSETDGSLDRLPTSGIPYISFCLYYPFLLRDNF